MEFFEFSEQINRELSQLQNDIDTWKQKLRENAESGEENYDVSLRHLSRESLLRSEETTASNENPAIRSIVNSLEEIFRSNR